MGYIGNEVRERMALLGLSEKELADRAFVDCKTVSAILNNEIHAEDIDDFDFPLICSVLHCKPEYFLDVEVKKRDFLSASMNRGMDDEKSIAVKAKLQDFMNDFEFVSEILGEKVKEGIE